MSGAKYRATLGSTALEVTVLSDKSLQIGDQIFSYDLVPLGTGRYSLLVEGEVFTVEVLEGTDNHAPESLISDAAPYTAPVVHLSLSGTEHSVRVDDERSWLLQSFLKKSHSAVTSTIVRAPMPGLIVRLEVGPGQKVRAGQGLVVLEAMKMENEIRSLFEGVVKAIHVEAGKPVEKGEPLMTLTED